MATITEIVFHDSGRMSVTLYGGPSELSWLAEHGPP